VSAPAIELRMRIVMSAQSWIGTPYRHQASLKGVGCDCLGLLRGVWREVMGPEPRNVPPYAADWAGQRLGEMLLEAAAAHLIEIERACAIPGDVLLFRWRRHLPVMHCGLMSAPGLMIHAHEGAAVTEVPLPASWMRRASHAFAFPGQPFPDQPSKGGQD
jgi:NlpC/P60 family putative phage cell wall peptidase